MNSLNTYAHNTFSQHGEDGIVAEIFERIGTKDKWCVELGALDGIHHSNTRELIVNSGWSAVLIEADPTYFERLQKSYARMSRTYSLNEFVSFEGPQSLDALFEKTPLPQNFDLLSLDIDGNEYHVWDALKTYRPRVILIEFNFTIPNDIAFIQPRDMATQQGSSLKALCELAHIKGYKLVAVTFGNAFFVAQEDFEKLGIAEPSLDEANPGTTYYTRLFQLYDGTLVLDGCTRLMWHNRPMDIEKMQTLGTQRYIAGISASPVVRRLKYWVRKIPLYSFIQRIRHGK